jgi:DNA topoisomerase I
MAKNLLIVESPAKAKTIKKYLGKDFEVLASYGHVRDLLAKEGAVDPAHDFAMTYALIEKNAKHVEQIVKAFKAADVLYLATDPDREGEAIAWHVYEILKHKKALKGKPVYRVVFHEITKSAVNAAVANPRDISMDLVNAQQARRALDYLVGFTLSPLLWKKVRRGLSAGRVQSPALRLIVEREEEIEAFKTQEYWTIIANNQADKQDFLARLIEYNREKLEQFSITTESQANEIKQQLEKMAQGHLQVTKVEKKQRKRNPAAPFTTSTLQQEAGRKLGFTAQRTMRLAQQLYEGIDVGQGAVGLITYMRTDSVNLSNEALAAIREFIVQRYGEKEVPEAPRQFRTKSRNAQEAHEAIRPTHVEYAPEQIKAHLTPEQRKLYELIWKRAVASQMIHATIDTVAVDLSAQGASDHCFRANGSVIVHPGFMAVYLESQDESKAKSDEEARMLPALKVGDMVDLLEISADQHFTEPPPRYSEASLVKALEERDIGRPSTYVPIISTLQNREYVILDQKRFKPTDVGRVVNKFLTRYFMQYVDYGFTAALEDKLDQISRGELEWVPLLKDFWMPFKTLVETTEETVQRKDVTQEALDENCPKCGKPLSIRLGKRGRFIGCSGYPDCDYTRNMEGEVTTASEPEVVEGRLCPDCGHALHVKLGRYGKFIGCSHYPKCKHMEPLEKPADTGIECPECHKGTLLKRKSRYGKIFYSCATYPTCSYAVWNEPIAQPCPRCAWPVMTIKTTKRRGMEKVCPRKECAYAEPMPTEDAS